MRIMPIQPVQLDFTAISAKYIVVKLSDGSLVVCSGGQYEYHANIADALIRVISRSGLSMHVLGGGKVNIDLYAKTIRLWGFSGAYGEEPDRKATATLIKQYHPNYDVSFS